MAWMNRGRTKRLVLDIGTSAIRLCELSPTKTGFQLTKYYQRELGFDPSVDEETRIAHREEVLQALLKEAKVRTKKTIIAVPGQSVFTRNRPLPPVPEYKVTQIVKYEIQQQIPFSLDQIALDYQVLDRTEAGGYDVMMAAIKVDVVEKQLEVLARTKRQIDVVDVAPLAAYNWLMHSGEFGDDGQCVALLDLGATTTDIVIRKDNQFRFTRSLHVGGNDVTSAIASDFNMSFLDAERLKRERGFAPTGNTERDGRGGAVVGKALGRLVSEINRSFAYFRSQPGGGPVSRVIVTGGGACLRNIIPYLQRQLGIEVRIAQPLAGLAIAPAANEASEHPEQACVALGLSLRCNEPVPIQINLIPPRVLEVARRREQVFYWVLSLVTLLLIMASIIPVTAAKDELAKGRIDVLKRVLAQYDPALVNDPDKMSVYEDELKIARNDVTGYEKDVNQLDSYRLNRSFWLEYLRIIDEARPTDGTIAISSIETAVIGGPANTGVAYRQAKMQAANAKENPEEQEVDPSRSLFAKFGATKGKKKPKVYKAEAFQGIFSIASKKKDRRKRQRDVTRAMVEPNGFVVFGYAEDVDVVTRYVERLKESGAFIEDGVYLHFKYLDLVPDSELEVARGAMSGAGGASSSGGGDFASSLAAAGIPGGRARAQVRRPSEYSEDELMLTVFHIDLQFYGDPVPKPDAIVHKKDGRAR